MRAPALALVVVLTAACGGTDMPPAAQTPSPSPTHQPSPATYQPRIVPAEFSTTIDNPWFPLVPGTRSRYRGTSAEGVETIVVEVLRTTKVVMGVTCVVVHDTVELDGEVIEDTYDWYAQAKDGTVWYFGEDTKELEAGQVVSTAGAWEAGVKDAQPGVVMPATPTVGQSFRQEHAAGEAEDEFRVLATDATATLATGTLTGLVMTEDTSRLDPDLVEHKYYARGTGFVLVEHVKGPAERIELVATERIQS